MPNQIYIVFCGSREPYVAERDLKDMGREETINDLARGEWGDINGARFNISNIIELGTDRDVTDEFIAAARMQMDSYRTPFSGQDKLDWEQDRRRALEMVS
jgi:hypothetical protein